MVEVVCIEHGGIRCAIPSTQVVAFRPWMPGARYAKLWEPHETAASGAEHVFELSTAAGPELVRGRGVRVAMLSPEAVRPISPVLRQFMTLPHVVGVSEVEGELVWLVDANRFRPSAGEVEQQVKFPR